MKKELKIDYISDMHIDFYINPKYNKEEFFERFFNLQSIIFPVYKDLGKVLVLAGDISHYIHQIKWICEFYSEMYEYIIYVHGNHEMYLLNGEKTYKEKLSLLKKELTLDKVYYLDGEIINIEGFNIGGLSMWYDFSYGVSNFDLKIEEMHKLWKEYMRDAYQIKDGETVDYYVEEGGKLREINFNPLKYFEGEKEKLENLKHCDLIVSHIMPFIPNNYPSKYKVPSSGFFCFDGKDFIEKNKIKYWIAGHTHNKIDEKKYGCRLLVNPYGYPNENWDKQMREITLITKN